MGGYRGWFTFVILLHAAIWVVMTYNAPGQLFDTCAKRADTCCTWDYWRVMGGQAFGLLPIGFAYWAMWHVTAGVNFWIGFVIALLGIVWHSVQGISFISDAIDCDGTTWCGGCTDRGPGDPDTDPVWILNWVLIWVCAIFCLIYLILLGVLRSRTEFGLFWWMASSTRTNGNVGLVPSPLGYGSQNPSDQAILQSPQFKLQVFLRGIRTFGTIIAFAHMCVLVVMAWNYSNLLIDQCVIREFHWEYIRIMGNSLGVVGLFAGYWILYHVSFGVWFWEAGIGCVLALAWHTVLFFFYVHDVQNCDSVIFCTGCKTPGHVDWPFTVNMTLCGCCMLANLIYIVVIFILRQRVDWALWVEMASETNYDPTSSQIVTPAGGLMSGQPSWMNQGNPAFSGGYVKMTQSDMNGASAAEAVPLTAASAAVIGSGGAGKKRDMLIQSPLFDPKID